HREDRRRVLHRQALGHGADGGGGDGEDDQRGHHDEDEAHGSRAYGQPYAAPAVAGPYETIAERMAAAAAARFVGRSVELAALLDVCEPGHQAAVVLVHGPGGIGKTALLDELARRLDEPGGRVLALDGAQVEPTPAAFTAAIAARLDVDATVAAIADQLASASHAVLLVDAVD
ncbi:hypothetical protein B7486_77980, partial [cyanobacterium TDX16]